MAEKKENRWIGVIVGPTLAFFAVVALWKNETRFDYHKAAARTKSVASLEDAVNGESFAFTGPMDQSRSLNGDYVEAFSGYLFVKRNAEIYCWDRDKDDDRVTWDLRWMGSVEQNSRNQGIRQHLSSKRFYFDQYDVGRLRVSPQQIEFVDRTISIQPTSLNVVREAFRAEGRHFYIRKKWPTDQLGDERVGYSGVQIPKIATYFGRFDNGRGVADTTHQRTGFINQIIKDKGVLHHLVAGEREVALATMKSHIRFLKWVVRGVGTAGVVLGCLIFSSTLLGLLYSIPVIGRIAEAGAIIAAFAVGIPIAGLTILSSYLIAHPLLLLMIFGSIVAAFYYLRRRGKSAQEVQKNYLQQQLGRIPTPPELKELEFIELAQLAAADDGLHDDEEEFLKDWAKRHRWDDAKYVEMLSRAKESTAAQTTSSNQEHLANLIRLTLADGTVSRHEIKTIHSVAKRLGYPSNEVRALVDRLRTSA